jgi:WD40 repeat protein
MSDFYQQAYSPNGKYLAAAHHDGSINLLDAETNKLMCKFPNSHSKAVRGLAFSADSRLLLCGSEDMHISMFEVPSAAQVAIVSGHTSWVSSVRRWFCTRVHCLRFAVFTVSCLLAGGI